MKIVPFWPGKTARPILDNVILSGQSPSMPYYEHAGYGLMAIRETERVVWIAKGTFLYMHFGGMRPSEFPRVKAGTTWVCRSFSEFIRRAFSK